MKTLNKLEVQDTLKVGVLPTALTSNLSVLLENEGLFQKRTLGSIINRNENEYLPSFSSSFPDIFNFNTSTTYNNQILNVSFKNQIKNTVFAAPTNLNGTPAFRMLEDSDLSMTSLGNKVDGTRLINTNNGLVGGGSLSSDLTLGIGNNVVPMRSTFLGTTNLTSNIQAGFYFQGIDGLAVVANGYPNMENSRRGSLSVLILDRSNTTYDYYKQEYNSVGGRSFFRILLDYTKSGGGINILHDWREVINSVNAPTILNNNFHLLAKNNTEATSAGYYANINNEINNYLGNVSLYSASGTIGGVARAATHIVSYGLNAQYGFQLLVPSATTNPMTIRKRINSIWSEETFAYQSWVNSNFVTTNTAQIGLSGDKTWTGVNRFNNNQFWRGTFTTTVLQDGLNTNTYLGTTTGIQNKSFNNYLSGSTLTSFLDIRESNGASMIYPLHISGTGNSGGNRGTGIQFNVGYSSATASAKPLLRLSASPLASGGNFIVSNYDLNTETWTDRLTVNNTGAYYGTDKLATESQIITPNNGLLTISTSSDLTGGGTFSADQATASNIPIGLSAGTLASLALANTAVQPSALNGYVPTNRTLTINNQTFDLSQNRTWDIAFTDTITTISRNGVNIPIVSQNVNIPLFDTSGAGLVPARVGSTTTRFLREDGTWVTPTNTTYTAGTLTVLNTGTSTTSQLWSSLVLNQWLNGKGFITSANLVGYATETWVKGFGLGTDPTIGYNIDTDTTVTRFMGVIPSTLGTLPFSYGNILNMSYSNGTEFSQIGIEQGGNRLRYRNKDGTGTIQPWRTVWDDGNFNPSNYVPFNGGNMLGDLGLINNAKFKLGHSSDPTHFIWKNPVTDLDEISVSTGFQVTQYSTTGDYSLLFVNSSTIKFKTWDIWHQGNFNPDDYISTNDLVYKWNNSQGHVYTETSDWQTNLAGKNLQGLGNTLTYKGEYANLIGYGIVGSGKFQNVVGTYNVNNGVLSNIYGNYNSSNASLVGLFGNFLYTEQQGQTVYGNYNKFEEPENEENLRKIHVFASGKSEYERDNAVEIFADNSTKLRGRGYYDEETRDEEWFSESNTLVDVRHTGMNHLPYDGESYTLDIAGFLGIVVRTNAASSITLNNFRDLSDFSNAANIYGICQGTILTGIQKATIHKQGTIRFNKEETSYLYNTIGITNKPYLVAIYRKSGTFDSVSYLRMNDIISARDKGTDFMVLIGSFNMNEEGAYFEFNQQIL